MNDNNYYNLNNNKQLLDEAEHGIENYPDRGQSVISRSKLQTSFSFLIGQHTPVN